MMRSAWLVGVLLAAGCNPPASPPPKEAPRPDPEDPPAVDPSAEPLFVAARQVCRLVHHRDEGIIAVAFAPNFFDTTPPAKLNATFYEVQTGLGECTGKMVVARRAGPNEGIVAVECEHGVLLLSIGLDSAPHRPMMALGVDMRPGAKLDDVPVEAAPPRPSGSASPEPSPGHRRLP